MTLPAPLGVNPFGQGSTPERIHALLRRLFGVGGYPEGDTGAWAGELEGYAVVLAAGGQAIERAGAQAFVTLATDLLEDHEREIYLPNDAARTIQERQTRLAAHERSAAGSAEANIEAALQTVTDVSVQVYDVLRATIEDEEVSDDAVFQVAVGLTLANYDVLMRRRAAAQLARRALPARAMQDAAVELEDLVVGNIGAIWGESTHVFDRDCLRQTRGGAPAITAGIHPPVRLVDYGPLSKLRSRDINAIQRALLFGPANGSAYHADVTSFGASGPGQDVIPFAISVPNAGNLALDSSVDWRDRFIVVAVVETNVDVRPGQANDDFFNDPGFATPVRRLMYSGTGGASYEQVLEGSSPNHLRLEVDAGTGAMRVKNNTGGTRYVAGWLVATADLGKR